MFLFTLLLHRLGFGCVIMFLTAASSPIEVLLQTIVVQYLSKTHCLTIVSEQPIYYNLNISFTYIYPANAFDDLVNQLLVVSEEGCSDYIVQMREPQKFMVAFEKVNHLGYIRRSDRKIIFLPYIEDNYNTNVIFEILSMKEASFIANILLIIPIKSGDNERALYNLVTHKFTGFDAEVQSSPLYLDRWDSRTEKFNKNTNLFPHNMSNLYGKTVKVGCFTYKPYVLLGIDTVEKPLGRDGLEVRIVDEFCRWINCTVKIVEEDIDQWGEIYDNQTGIGVLGSVVEDRADMGITALYSWYKEWKDLDYSNACIRSAVTCLAPAPRLLSSWEMPLLPFSWYMWLAVVVTFLFVSIGLMVAQRCSSDRILLTVFGMMIAQSQFNADGTWRVRSIIGWLLVAVLVLVNAYAAGLASTFTVPKYEPSIDTVHDIVDRKMEWGATHDAWIFSLTLSSEPLVKQLVSLFRTYPSEELKRRSLMRNMALSVEKLPAGYFAIGEYITKNAVLNMTLMLEDFYYEQCVVMLRKSSPYTGKMNELVGRLHQSGLLLAWETQVALKHMDYKVQLEVKLSRSKYDVVTKSLSLSHVGGVFILYSVGMVISILTFIGEILIKCYKKNKNLLNKA